MFNERTERAVEAAAKTLHEEARDREDWTWEDAPDDWKEMLKNSVRPMVEAALAAADAYELAKTL